MSLDKQRIVNLTKGRKQHWFRKRFLNTASIVNNNLYFVYYTLLYKVAEVHVYLNSSVVLCASEIKHNINDISMSCLRIFCAWTWSLYFKFQREKIHFQIFHSLSNKLLKKMLSLILKKKTVELRRWLTKCVSFIIYWLTF